MRVPNFFLCPLFSLLCFLCSIPNAAAEPLKLMLRDGWQVRSSANDRWYPTSVPSTVLAALVANKVYPDPYFGMNLRSIPGTTYPIGRNFAALPMPDDSPFHTSWRYKTEVR